jgi:hypothetical protein
MRLGVGEGYVIVTGCVPEVFFGLDLGVFEGVSEAETLFALALIVDAQPQARHSVLTPSHLSIPLLGSRPTRGWSIIELAYNRVGV